MTEKEIMVLIHFLEKESEFILHGSSEENHYYTYPGEIERELGSKVSRVHAKEVCEKFVENGILKADAVSSKKTTYFLNHDFEAFKKISCVLIQNIDINRSVEVLGYDYFQSKINRSLIIRMLHERNISFRRRLDILNWKDTEARNLFENKLANKKIQISLSQSKLLKSGMTFEELLKEMPDSDITSLDIYAQRKLERMDDKDSDKYRNQFYPVDIEIVFPALDISNEKDIVDNISEIQSLNKELFEIYPDLLSCTSAILEHYVKWQEDNVIIPILLLTKTSPTALVRFLRDDWDLDDNNFCQDYLTGILEPLINMLIFSCLSDLALTRSYPKNNLIRNIGINSPIFKMDQKEEQEGEMELLSFEDDIGQIYYQSSAFSIRSSYGKNMPSGGFTIVGRGKTYSRDLVNRANDFTKSIQDYSSVIRYLKTDNPVAQLISNKFSGYLNNLIKHIDPAAPIPVKLLQSIEIGLKEVLVSEGWYDILFLDIRELSGESIELLKPLWDMIERFSDSVHCMERVIAGRSVLSDVFKEAISANESIVDHAQNE